MCSRWNNGSRSAGIAAVVLVATLGAMFTLRGAAAADLSVCIDQANPSSVIDVRVARAAARAEGYKVTLVPFRGYGKGGDGLPLSRFAKMAQSDCQLIMGFPLDASTSHLPPDVEATSAYASTGFVLVRRMSSTEMSLGELPAGSEVGIAQLDTYAGLLFDAHPNMVMHVYPKDALMLADLEAKRIAAALAWQPYAESYEAHKHARPSLRVARLPGDHMLYNLVALYAPQSQGAANVFERGLYDLQSKQQLRRLVEPYSPAVAAPAQRPSSARNSATGWQLIQVSDRSRSARKDHGKLPPALYTADQATRGSLAYYKNCSMCHGPLLDGQSGGYSGPALKGSDFADPSYDFHVGDIFNFVAKLMPADSPGRLSHEDDVEVMAFILQQNGYPAGSKELAYEEAQESKVPIRYYAK